MYKIYKSAAAENDLVDIWVYTLQQWGIEQADKCIDDLAVTFRLLAANPLIGTERHQFVPPVRFHHHGRHVIVYTVESDRIFIIRVLHDRADPARHI
jgi:toxin ParE1/3/4